MKETLNVKRQQLAGKQIDKQKLQQGSNILKLTQKASDGASPGQGNISRQCLLLSLAVSLACGEPSCQKVTG
ncbi:hypothetical protein STEG23_012160, partial [Scotinomys teguina]